MTGTAITDQDINHLWWTAYQADDSRTAITATEALGHGPFGGADDIARARREAGEIIQARREAGTWTEPPAPAGDDECPSWCVGDDPEDGHVNEWDGVTDFGDDDRHVLARTVQGLAADAEAGVQLAMNDDGKEVWFTLTPGQADDLAEVLRHLADCARRAA